MSFFYDIIFVVIWSSHVTLMSWWCHFLLNDDGKKYALPDLRSLVRHTEGFSISFNENTIFIHYRWRCTSCVLLLTECIAIVLFCLVMMWVGKYHANGLYSTFYVTKIWHVACSFVRFGLGVGVVRLHWLAVQGIETCCVVNVPAGLHFVHGCCFVEDGIGGLEWNDRWSEFFWRKKTQGLNSNRPNW